MDTCTSRMHSTAPSVLRGSRRMRLSYAMQRGIPAGQVRHVSIHVLSVRGLVRSAVIALDLSSCEPVFRTRAQQGVRCLLPVSLFFSTFSVSSDADLLSSDHWVYRLDCSALFICLSLFRFILLYIHPLVGALDNFLALWWLGEDQDFSRS